MNKTVRKIALVTSVAAILCLCSIVGIKTSAFAPAPSANGQGSLGDRKFAFSARLLDAGTCCAAQGNAVLHNPAFTGDNGHSPYMLQIDIKCMNKFGNTVYFGGTTRRTNESDLVDAVFFAVQDNGEPGKGVDKVSRAFFFDDNPATHGDPMICQFNQVTDFPLETITAGNVQVK
ncbi:MAG: hypothetical protein ACJ73D_08695 [Pyrinomonadaceae bacterium]